MPLSVIQHTALTIGFEQEMYTFSEPTGGLSRTMQPVCIEVMSGQVGTPISVVPSWPSGSATGIYWAL